MSTIPVRMGQKPSRHAAAGAGGDLKYNRGSKVLNMSFRAIAETTGSVEVKEIAAGVVE